VFKEHTGNYFLTLAKHPSLLPNTVLKSSLFRDVAWRKLFVGSWLSPTNLATSQKSENLDGNLRSRTHIAYCTSKFWWAH